MSLNLTRSLSRALKIVWTQVGSANFVSKF